MRIVKIAVRAQLDRVGESAHSDGSLDVRTSTSLRSFALRSATHSAVASMGVSESMPPGRSRSMVSSSPSEGVPPSYVRITNGYQSLALPRKNGASMGSSVG